VGRYYQAIAASRIGQADEALSLLQAVADNAPLVYRARAIQTLGSIHHRHGHYDEALRLSHEASLVASPENGRDPLTTLLVQLELSCIKSDMGDHRGAFADCENLSPLVHIVARQNPLYFYLYHNELAIEFAELGRLAEAEAASAIALASPFAAAYPEWSDTRDEIAKKRVAATPSVVAVKCVLEPDLSPETERHLNPKPVTKFPISCPARNKDSFQRSTITIPARAAIALNATSILDRMLICIGPRAPPLRT
jgi:tetratricopeptide (TPR) repeat protein